MRPRLRLAGAWINYFIYEIYILSAEHSHAVDDVGEEDEDDTGERVHLHLAI